MNTTASITEVEILNAINSKTKPLGSLGLLEVLAFKICSIQQSIKPVLTKPSIVVFAGDHGVVDEGVSAYPREVTRQMVLNFVQGGSAVSVFARQNNLHLEIVDAGVDYNFDVSLPILHNKVGLGTKNMLIEPALHIHEVDENLKRGREVIKQLAQNGCNAIGFGEMGIGNTSSAALITSIITGIPLENCVGRGAGLDDSAFEHKLHILNQVYERATSFGERMLTPKQILSEVGGHEIAQMVGAYLEALEHNMIIVVDGFIATSALLIAHELQSINSQSTDKQFVQQCIFSHLSEEQGHRHAVDYLQGIPLLQWGMRLGEGSASALVFPLLQSACDMMNYMASFTSAGVSTATNSDKEQQ
jgi:nicotinate-nucleotide--dimethylbenzimidazole phosphoribosyltransferase